MRRFVATLTIVMLIFGVFGTQRPVQLNAQVGASLSATIGADRGIPRCGPPVDTTYGYYLPEGFDAPKVDITVRGEHFPAHSVISIEAGFPHVRSAADPPEFMLKVPAPREVGFFLATGESDGSGTFACSTTVLLPPHDANQVVYYELLAFAFDQANGSQPDVNQLAPETMLPISDTQRLPSLGNGGNDLRSVSRIWFTMASTCAGLCLAVIAVWLTRVSNDH